jgi:hypothetical protein
VLSVCVKAAPALTFHKDVEPILENRCQSCHRPGEAGPMPLLTYSETRPWAKAIRAALLAGKMPPWQADPRYGKFSNDLRLAPGEKETLVAWIDGGAAEGNPADAPKPKTWIEGWRIPKPDVVFEMPQDFTVPASGAIDYQYISVATHFTEDKWIEAAEVVPGNRAAVHHAIVVIDTTGGARGGEFGDYLAGYAPGMSPQMWKSGQARLVKAGATLTFQMHYQATGKPVKDRTRIGLVFAKKPATEQIVALQAAAHWLAVPPMEANYRISASETIRQPAMLVGLRPHMHLRGKSFRFVARYPNGESEILLEVPKFDFNWQPYYYLETPKPLPVGTRIEADAVFDNSPNNPVNPDPAASVFWGPQTWDEMMIGWIDIAVPANALRRFDPGTGF